MHQSKAKNMDDISPGSFSKMMVLSSAVVFLLTLSIYIYTHVEELYKRRIDEDFNWSEYHNLNFIKVINEVNCSKTNCIMCCLS